jgi:Putative auto-transporter adhesin, head GIN domain
MRRAAIWFLLVVGHGACGFGVVGNGDVTTQSRAVTGFTGVTSNGSAAITVREGAAYSVNVTTDSNLQRRVETRVQDDTLVVDENDVADPTELRVDIQLPSFRAGSLAGSGTFDAAAASLHDVDVTLAGSGTMAFSGNATAVTASLPGSGTLRLGGSADSLFASLSGSGFLDARDLPANRATVDLDGSGRVQATILESATLRLGGSGSIDWWGPATLASATTDGSGYIAHH